MASNLTSDAGSIAAKIFDMARQGDIDSSALVMALAQVLGVTAAQLDLIDRQSTLDQRLSAFNDAVAEVYFRRVSAPQLRMS